MLQRSRINYKLCVGPWKSQGTGSAISQRPLLLLLGPLGGQWGEELPAPTRPLLQGESVLSLLPDAKYLL